MALTAAISELKALVEFLDGLTELSNRTGVMACAYDGTYLEFGDRESLRINSRREDDGRITYFIEEHDA